MKRLASKKYLYFSIVIVCYGIWAAYYIYRTSFIAQDGTRYFALFDDAMISMRYGWNLAHGRGLVWNEGERVEGITNTLMTLYMGLWTLFLSKKLAVLAVQISGALFVLLSGFLCVRVGTRIIGQERAVACPTAVILFLAGISYFPFNFWTLFGMETGMVAVLLLSAVSVLLKVDGRPVASRSMALLLGLGFLARPDTAVAAAVILAFRWRGIAHAPGWARAALLEGAIVAAFVIGATLFRLGYYGEPLPNTYTLKITGMPLAFRVEQGIRYIAPFALVFSPIALISLAGAFFPLQRQYLIPVAIFAGFIGYHVTIGLDPFVYWRQLSPYVPLMLAGFIAAALRSFQSGFVERAIERTLGEERRSLVTGVGISAVGLAALVFLNWEYLPLISFDKHVPTRWDNRYATNIALAMNEILEPHATIALFHAGYISYYTDFKAIDCLGKSDKVIARRPPDLSRQQRRRGRPYLSPGHNKYDLSYSIKTLEPTYIERAKWAGESIIPYARKHYEKVRYKRVILSLRKDSNAVRWHKLSRRAP
jgi:hypothetical protein